MTRNLTVAIYKAGTSLQVPIDVVQNSSNDHQVSQEGSQNRTCLVACSSDEELDSTSHGTVSPGVAWRAHARGRKQVAFTLAILFLATFQQCDPDNPVLTDGTDLEAAIPYMIHGAEAFGDSRSWYKHGNRCYHGRAWPTPTQAVPLLPYNALLGFDFTIPLQGSQKARKRCLFGDTHICLI